MVQLVELVLDLLVLKELLVPKVQLVELEQEPKVHLDLLVEELQPTVQLEEQELMELLVELVVLQPEKNLKSIRLLSMLHKRK